MLLATILKEHPRLRGTLFDVAGVVSRAAPILAAAGVTDRCRVLAGDFFRGVPESADGYLLANVLHDWDDDRCVAILRNCRRALAPGGSILLVERLIADEPGAAVPTLLSDINMLVFTGGQERTNGEYERLFRAADLALACVRPAAFSYGVVEARAG